MFAVVVAVVVIVIAEVTADPLGVTLVGAKVHVASEGNPEQAKVTAWLNPLEGVTVSVEVPEEPAVTVAKAGLAAIEKSGAGAAPVPESATVCGLLLALSVIDTEAVRVPAAVGLNVTLIEQLADAATLALQVFVWL